MIIVFFCDSRQSIAFLDKDLFIYNLIHRLSRIKCICSIACVCSDIGNMIIANANKNKNIFVCLLMCLSLHYSISVRNMSEKIKNKKRCNIASFLSQHFSHNFMFTVMHQANHYIFFCEKKSCSYKHFLIYAYLL